jgi:formylglycine-generating enzyme required for sulfatase activity
MPPPQRRSGEIPTVREAMVATPRVHVEIATHAVVTPRPVSSAREPSSARWLLVSVGLVGVLVASLFALRRIDRSSHPETLAALPPPPAPRGCPEGMTRIPGGTFRMGTTDGKPEEAPVHELRVGSFCLDMTEVSTAAFQRCDTANACPHPSAQVDWGGIPEEARERESKACSAYQQTNRGRTPLNCVSWEDATKFCAWRGGRLPTEVEWEYAARGGDEERRFPWGEEAPSVRHANVCDATCIGAPDDAPPLFPSASDGFSRTAPTGSYPAGASRWGPLDLAGNVWEWTSSSFCHYPSHDCDARERAFRGGGFESRSAQSLRTTTRLYSDPTFRYADVGFRCAADAAE